MKIFPFVRYHVLLPVHPEYAEKLVTGQKTVEFRKKAFCAHINRIIIYATAPVKKVIGSVEMRFADFYNLDTLWKMYGKNGCISKGDFYRYFQGYGAGYAIHVCNPLKLEEPIDIRQELDSKFRAPQSFAYIPKTCPLTKLLKQKGGLP